MDEKLTKEECERLTDLLVSVAMNNVLTKSDMVKVIDVLYDACAREKADVERLIGPISDIVQ